MGALGTLVGAPRPTVLVLLVGAAAWAGHRLWRGRLDARERVATRHRVLETCDLLAAELSSGQPPGTALARAARDLAGAGARRPPTTFGGDVPTALRVLAARPGAEGLALVAAAWQVAHRTGHGLADALTRQAESLRQAAATGPRRPGRAGVRAGHRPAGGGAARRGAGDRGGLGGDPVGFLLGRPAASPAWPGAAPRVRRPRLDRADRGRDRRVRPYS